MLLKATLGLKSIIKFIQKLLKYLLIPVSQSVCLSPRGCMLVSLSATTLRMEICSRGRPQKWNLEVQYKANSEDYHFAAYRFIGKIKRSDWSVRL